MSTEHSQFEHTGSEEVSGLLKRLPRVTAPSDFDMRLRSRIAARSSKGSSRSGWWLIGVAAPASMVLIAVISVYFGVFRAGTGKEIVHDVPAITETQLPQVEDSYITQMRPADQRSSASPQPMPTVASNVQTNSFPVNANTLRTRPSTGLSEDRAATAADEPLLPPGISPNSRGNDLPPGSTARSVFSVGEILELIGIRADVSAGKWTVRSVAANGAAGRSGVQAGDVIVAIDRTVLSERTVIDGPANVRSITVRRGGSVIQLPVGNQ